MLKSWLAGLGGPAGTKGRLAGWPYGCPAGRSLLAVAWGWLGGSRAGRSALGTRTARTPEPVDSGNPGNIKGQPSLHSEVHK